MKIKFEEKILITDQSKRPGFLSLLISIPIFAAFIFNPMLPGMGPETVRNGIITLVLMRTVSFAADLVSMLIIIKDNASFFSVKERKKIYVRNRILHILIADVIFFLIFLYFWPKLFVK